MEPLLVRAARREPVERTPVWFMRQAGRSLPEYRALRERRGFFEINESSELTAEVTLQPVRRHRVDAAVIFADIMTPVAAMGIDVELVEGVGPVVARPMRSVEDVERLRVPDPAEAVGPVLEAIAVVRRELAPEQAVVGFCGGPFTVAGYVVEGRPSREFATVKALMYSEPRVWHALMEKLADTFARYVRAQADAGADVVQLFDSWVGALSVADYEEFVAPWSARILAAARVPTIHFGTGAVHLLPALTRAGGDVVGLDWRIPLDEGWTLAGPDRGVQGNLDPAVLLGPWERVAAGARDVLARAGGRPGHIFNLGHGVLPQTDADVLTRLRELVHEETTRDVATGGIAGPSTASPATGAPASQETPVDEKSHIRHGPVTHT
jgi:uroporphyrinogen decarboxylase